MNALNSPVCYLEAIDLKNRMEEFGKIRVTAGLYSKHGFYYA